MATPEIITNIFAEHRKAIITLIIIGIFILFLKWFQVIHERLRDLK